MVLDEMMTEPRVRVVVTTVMFTAAATCIVILRLYSRISVVKNIWLDDYLMLAALVFSFLYAALAIIRVHFGLGLPAATLSTYEMEAYLHCLWATFPVYHLSLILSKVSIVCQYKRLFPIETPIRFCNMIIAFLVIYATWTLAGSILTCWPIYLFWTSHLDASTCIDKLAFWYTNAAVNIATDLLIFFMPIPVLAKMTLPRKQKGMLMALFALGAFVCVTSIIRLHGLYDSQNAPDLTLGGVNVVLWSAIEVNTAIACSSIPALKPLASRMFPRLLQDSATTASDFRFNPEQFAAMNTVVVEGEAKSTVTGTDGSTTGVNDGVGVNTDEIRPATNRSQRSNKSSWTKWISECYPEAAKTFKRKAETV